MANDRSPHKAEPSVSIGRGKPRGVRWVVLGVFPGRPYAVRPDDLILGLMDKAHVQKHPDGGYTWWGLPRKITYISNGGHAV